MSQFCLKTGLECNCSGLCLLVVAEVSPFQEKYLPQEEKFPGSKEISIPKPPTGAQGGER